MANGVRTRTYQIVINGLTESISAVDALNKQLEATEARIKAIDAKKISISSSSSGGGGGTGALSEEEKILKQIEQTEEKIKAIRGESYQQLLNQKDILKDTKKEEASAFAADNLAVKEYSNTLLGLKDRLHDIKAAMQTEEIGNERFNQLSKEAGEITQKLKEIEASYGTFSRNVGNYASAAEGFKGLKIEVGGISEEFENARQAYMTLKKEMETLEVKKSLGTITDEETERLKSLIPTVKTLKSTLDDAGKPMDAIMDTMQSIVALASAGKGLAAFFGLEDTGVEESIKKLVALQNVLTSFQTIQKQLQTEEGLGKYFSKGNKAIDNFVAKLLGVKTASVQAAAAEKTATVATNQLETASKGATLAVKGLSTALKAIGIGLLIGFISSAVDALSNLFKKSEKGKEAIDALDMSINALNRSTENMMQMYDKLYDSGSISRVEKLTEQYKLQAEYVENIVEAMRQRQAMDEKSEGIDFGVTFDGDDSGLFKIKRNIEDIREEWEELQYNITNGIEEEKLIIGVENWLEEPKTQMEELNDASKQLLNDFVGRIQKAEKTLAKAQEDVKNGVAGADEKLKEAKKTIKDLEDEMNNDRILNSVIANLDKYIPDEAVRKACQSIFNSLHMITTGMDADAARLQQRMHDLVIGLLPEQQQALARAKEQYEQDLEAFNDNLIGKALATAKYKKEVDRINSLYASGTTSGRTIHTTSSAIAKQERDINKLRLRLMNEGLNKRLMQLDEEKRQTLAKLKQNNEEYIEAERIYNQLRIQEIEKYISKVNEALSTQKIKIETDSFKNQIDEIENEILRLEKTVPGINELFTKNELSTLLNKVNYQAAMEYLQMTANAEKIGFENIDAETKEAIDSLKEKLQIELNTLKFYEDLETAELKDSFKIRIDNAREYYTQTLDVITTAIEKERKIKEDQLNYQLSADTNAAAERYKEQKAEYEKELEAAQQQFDALKSIANEGHTNLTDAQREEWKQLQDIILVNQEYIKQATENFTKEVENLEKEHGNAVIALNLETIERRSAITQKYFDTQIENYRDFNSKLNQEIQKQPVIYKGGLDIINIGATRKNFNEIRDAVKTVLLGIQEDKNELNAKWAEGILTPEAYSSALRQLNDLESAATEEFGIIGENIKQAWGEWWGSINRWLQELGQAASTIMYSIAEITSNGYEKQIDEQQKYIDEYSDQLDKQKQKTQEYADAVNSIEDELANARGDRRSHLIDQLNAEIQAQRASLAEQKRIEKEKEKAEHKKADLEYFQALAEKKMSVAQAKLNAVMAISNAAVNKWPIPAIPMIALATAVGAAQVAAANSQYIPKPSYGDGGVIVGKAHKDGGVPVLGGQAEVEGGEFITNKRTTSQNTPLLEYINSKKKRIDLADMVEFFNDKPRATIKNIRSKFADGGVLTTPNVDISNQMKDIVLVQSQQPIYVAVTDIENAQNRLNKVRVLSGIK